MTAEASHVYYNDDLDSLYTLSKQGACSSKYRELDHSCRSSTLKKDGVGICVKKGHRALHTGEHCGPLCPHLATEN